MIRIIRGLLDQLEATQKALTMHGAALRELARDLEDGSMPPAAAAAYLRVLADESAITAVPEISLPPPIVSSDP